MADKTIITLDLGTKTGWAIKRESSSLITSGVMDFTPSRYDGGGMRFVRFRAWLRMLEFDDPLEAIYFEEVRAHAGTDAAHIYGGFLAHLTEWCESRPSPLPYQGVPVGTIKKFATGKGNASKQEVIAAMIERGHRINNDNEADALALMYFVLNNLRETK
jgi:hypothetical protein